MSKLKIVKDAQGRTVGFGPNADFYQPGIPDGGTLEYGDEAELYVEPAPEPIFADLKAAEIATYIETREKMCARVAGIGQRLGRAGDSAGALSCDAVVNALLDVLAHPTVTGAADIAALKLALKTRYLAAVGLASASARTEFKRYDK